MNLFFSIVYRHMEKVLTKAEVNQIHKQIEDAVEAQIGGSVRR